MQGPLQLITNGFAVVIATCLWYIFLTLKGRTGSGNPGAKICATLTFFIIGWLLLGFGNPIAAFILAFVFAILGLIATICKRNQTPDTSASARPTQYQIALHNVIALFLVQSFGISIFQMLAPLLFGNSWLQLIPFSIPFLLSWRLMVNEKIGKQQRITTSIIGAPERIK